MSDRGDDLQLRVIGVKEHSVHLRYAEMSLNIREERRQKRTTTKTVTKRIVFPGRLCKPKPVPAPQLYQKCKYIPQMRDDQVALAEKLPVLEPVLVEPIQRAVALAEKLSDRAANLKDPLKNAKTPEDLVNLQQELIDEYLALNGKPDSEIVQDEIRRCLLFTARFPKVEFAPRDCAVEAGDTAIDLDGESRMYLLKISELTACDFIDAGLQQAIGVYLAGSDNVRLRVIAWMYAHISPGHVVTGQGEPVLTVDRHVEIPEYDEAQKGPGVQERTLVSTVLEGKRKAKSLVRKAKESDAMAEWVAPLTDILTGLKGMKGAFLDAKLIGQKVWLSNAYEKLREFQEWLPADDESTAKRAQRLERELLLMNIYCSYANECGVFTVYSFINVLRDARDLLLLDLEDADNPILVSRNAVVIDSLDKLMATAKMSSLSEKMVKENGPILLALQDEVESSRVSDFILLAEWIVRTQSIERSPDVTQLNDTMDTIERAVAIMNSKSDKVGQAVCEEWTPVFNSWKQKLMGIASVDPVQPNEDILTEMRDAVDDIIERRVELDLEREIMDIVEELEATITQLTGKPYRRKKKTARRSTNAGANRVQFVQAPLFKESGLCDYNLLPKDFKHPTYALFDAAGFENRIVVSKPLPKDRKTIGGSLKVAKLAARRSVSISGSVALVGLQALFLKASVDVKRIIDVSPDEYDARAEASIVILDRIEKELAEIDLSRSFIEHVMWLEVTTNELDKVIWINHPEVAERYDTFRSAFNDFLTRLINAVVLILPLPVLAVLHKHVSELVDVLASYKRHEDICNEKDTVEDIDAWIEYLEDMGHIINTIRLADDEVAVYMAKQFIIIFGAAMSSFMYPADQLDKKAKRRTLALLTSAIQKISKGVSHFNDKLVASELSTVGEVMKQLDELAEAFHGDDISERSIAIFNEVSADVRTMLSAPDVNLSIADNACQKLRAVHNALGEDVRALGDPAYVLFTKTVAVRVSIRNLHAADAELEQKLENLATLTIKDFDTLISYLAPGLDSTDGCKAEFTRKWIAHLKVCQRDVEGVQKEAEIAIQSPSRYPVFAANLNDVQDSLIVLEAREFPLEAQPYNKLALHLEKFIEYCNAKHGVVADKKRKKTQDSVMTQMLFMSFATVSAVSSQSNYDSQFDDFADGFTQTDGQKLRSDIVDNVSESWPDQDSREYKVTSAFGRLFAAHADAFTGNYGICSRSTRVCSELVIEFCESIMESTRVGAAVMKGDDITELEEVITKHVNAIQRIESRYDDRVIHSEFGRQRLTVFAHMCCVLAQTTALNIYHLATQDRDPFDFDEVKAHVRPTLQIFQKWGTKFVFAPVFDRYQDVEQLSSMLDETSDRLVVFLSTESQFCAALHALVVSMLEELDAKLWEKRGMTLKISSSEIAPPSTDSEHVTASDLKRSVDIIADVISQFQSILAAGEIDEAGLSTEIDKIDEMTKMLCDRSVCIQADDSFYGQMHNFRHLIAELLNHLRTELYTGTYSIYSPRINNMVQGVSTMCAGITRQLGHLEQLEENASDTISNILTRLAKLLLLARDELATAAERVGGEVTAAIARSAGASYETVSGILLTIRQSNRLVIRQLQTTKLAKLQHVIFATQSVLNEAAVFEASLTNSSADDRTESPEFMIKANFEPVVAALSDVRRSISHIVPNAGLLVQLLSSVITQINIAIEPRYEERPMFSLTHA